MGSPLDYQDDVEPSSPLSKVLDIHMPSEERDGVFEMVGKFGLDSECESRFSRDEV